MMVISYGNIDQLKKKIMFNCKWIKFYDINWKEKSDFRKKLFNRNEIYIIIISILRYDRYKNEDNWHNTTEQTIN